LTVTDTGTSAIGLSIPRT